MSSSSSAPAGIGDAAELGQRHERYLPMTRLKLHLCALDPAMIAAWSACFGAEPDVTLFEGNILSLRGDAIVSPANSFGFMDGGIDLAYAQFFGPDLPDRLQQ